MSSDKIKSKVTIIKEGLQVGTQPIAVGSVLEVDDERKNWLAKRAFIAPSSDTAAATTAATTTTPSKSKAPGLASPSIAEEAK